MPETPRIIFTVFSARTEAMITAWTHFSGQLLPDTVGCGADASATDDDPALPKVRSISPPGPLGGVWRLLATNNREIARSARVYPSFLKARADVDRIRANRDDLVVAPVNGADRGTRGWYATLAGEPVLTCSRWYETSSSSLTASLDAVEALECALVVEAVRTIESADRRRRRSRVAYSSEVGW
jgi:hypothetical protein